jgi:hypothetical protein
MAFWETPNTRRIFLGNTQYQEDISENVSEEDDVKL